MGRVSYGRSGTGRGTPLEVRDGSGDSRGGPGRVENPQVGPGLVVGLPGRSGTGRGTLPKGRDG